MDDARLLALRRDPPPEFAARLRANLRQQEEIAPGLARRPSTRLGTALSLPKGRSFNEGGPIRQVAAAAAIAIGTIALLSIPAVRASAQSFLALFRVVNFVAVPVDEGRIDTLKQLDVPQLAGENVTVLQDPGPPLPMASPEQAAAAAGISLRVPTWLPPDAKTVEISVRGEYIARVTANATRLEQVMESLGITDLPVPAGLDGQMLTIRIPPVMMVRYEHGGRHSRFLQARSPEVTMPAGVDPAALGEIGLRVLGLPREDARQFARKIDWNTTLLVAVPPTAGSFKQVDVSGNPGIAIEHRPPNESRTSMVLWSGEGRVFAIVSIQEMSQVMRMANSVR